MRGVSRDILVTQKRKWLHSPNQAKKGTHQKKISTTISLVTKSTSNRGCIGQVGYPVTILTKLGQNHFQGTK